MDEFTYLTTTHVENVGKGLKQGAKKDWGVGEERDGSKHIWRKESA